MFLFGRRAASNNSRIDGMGLSVENVAAAWEIDIFKFHIQKNREECQKVPFSGKVFLFNYTNMKEKIKL